MHIEALSFAAAIGVLLAFIGPFGAYRNPLPLRMLDSLGMAMAATALSGLLIPLQLRVGLRAGLPLLFTIAVSVAVTALPVAGLSCVAARLLWPEHVADFAPSDWYFQALLMLSCVFALWLLLETARGSLRRDRAVSPSRLSPSESSDYKSRDSGVLCLQTEDNYVRFHRAEGSSLELTPLHQAIERLGNLDGLQVHRGWWVAKHAVEAAERDGRNWRLRLKNGLRVPIARNRVAIVRALGWLNDE
jgi:LytTr DNA-binding domain